MLLSELVDVYARHRLGVSAGWVEQVRIAVRLFGAWVGRVVRTDDLTTDNLLGFLADLNGKRAASTVNGKRGALLTLWIFGHENGHVTEPPPKIPKIKQPHRLPDAWTVAEIERLLAVCRSLDGYVAEIPRRHYWPALVLLCYDTGQRIGTIFQVWQHDCHLAERFVIFRGETQKQGDDTFHSLSDQTVAALVPMCCQTTAELFPWPYRKRHLWTVFRRDIVEPAGLRASKSMGLFHKLRRTSGSLVEANGGDGSRHLGNSRAVFERSYRDPRICGGSQLDKLPRPKLSGVGGNGSGDEFICG